MNLDKLRKKHKLTQQEASRLLNMQKQTYQNYELGKREPDISTLIKLADFYHTSIDDLVGRKVEHINLEVLDPTTKKLIECIFKMNETQKIKVKAYLDGLMDN